MSDATFAPMAPKKLPEGDEKEPITIRVRPDTAAALRVEAAIRNVRMGAVIDELVAKHLAKAPKRSR